MRDDLRGRTGRDAAPPPPVPRGHCTVHSGVRGPVRATPGSAVVQLPASKHTSPTPLHPTPPPQLPSKSNECIKMLAPTDCCCCSWNAAAAADADATVAVAAAGDAYGCCVCC